VFIARGELVRYIIRRLMREVPDLVEEAVSFPRDDNAVPYSWK
jgi:hypothetical protein